MGKPIFLPCVAMLIFSAPALAQAPTAAKEIAPSDAQQAISLSGGGKPAPVAEDKKVCKQLDSTGSRLPRRACLTQREWKQLQDELQQ